MDYNKIPKVIKANQYIITMDYKSGKGACQAKCVFVALAYYLYNNSNFTFGKKIHEIREKLFDIFKRKTYQLHKMDFGGS